MFTCAPKTAGNRARLIAAAIRASRLTWAVWLGREDSNLRMGESKSPALPLGDAPSGRVPAFMGADIATGTRGFQPCWRPPGPHIQRSTTKVPPCPCGPAYRHARASPRRRSVAQPGSAPRSGRGGRRFKSCHSDHLHQGFLSPIPNKGDRYDDRNERLSCRFNSLPATLDLRGTIHSLGKRGHQSGLAPTK